MASYRRKFYPCACGCGRKMAGYLNWDGYHGPDLQAPPVEPVSLSKHTTVPQKRQNAGSRRKGARSRRSIGEAVGEVIDAIVDALSPW